MSGFNVGQRVFDKECGEFGKVNRVVSKGIIEVAYDHEWGCDSNLDFTNVDDLELDD